MITDILFISMVEIVEVGGRRLRCIAKQNLSIVS